jgi:dolichyl-phosphate beta-glucosyltransferase
VVDDGSADRTVEVAHGYTVRHGAERVRVLRLGVNQGKGAAVRRGVLAARGTRVLMADADGATVFAELERMEAEVGGGADVAIGSRTHLKGRGAAEGRSALRGFVSTVFNLCVLYVAGVVGLRDTQCGFKLYSREAAVVAFAGQRLDRWAFDVENLYRVQRAGMRVVEVPVRWTEVPGSKLSVVKATVNMVIDMVRMRVAYSLGRWTVDAVRA